jgi:glutamine amidotransferase PdxT
MLSLPMAVRSRPPQGKLFATSFHPELTNDLRFHQYFLELQNRNPSAEPY